jgi:hypothetical protein
MSISGEDAFFHNAHGRFAGRTSVLNAQHLWSLSSRTDDWPTFCQQMCNLFARYTDKMPSGVAGRKILLENNWATPRVLVSAFQALFSTNSEKFASPLNVHPATQHYWTLCAADTRLGASTDAYGHDWSDARGSAALVNPEYEDVELAKAVQWGVHAAQRDEHACLFVVVVPCWQRKAYHTQLCAAHLRTHRLCTIPRAAKFNFVRASYGAEPGASHFAHFAVDIWLVGNSRGLEEHLRETPENVAALEDAIPRACTAAGTHVSTDGHATPPGDAPGARVLITLPTEHTAAAWATPVRHDQHLAPVPCASARAAPRQRQRPSRSCGTRARAC